jgi:CysZ protein
MLFHAAFTALAQTFSKEFRPLFWRSLGMTVLLLAICWAGLTKGITLWLDHQALANEHGFLTQIANILAGAGLMIGLAYFIPTISILVSSFFLDDIAEKIESRDYPHDPVGVPVPVARAVREGIRFTALTLGVNLLALLVFLLPFINAMVFFFANALLMGREYFALAAGRFAAEEEVAALRRRHSVTLWLAGMMLAFFVSIPLLNLFTPLFATSLMVHVHKALRLRDARHAAQGSSHV